MKCVGLWYGGSSYSAPDRGDYEKFDSIADAKRTFRYRAEGSDRYYPCVEDSSMLIYLAKDESEIDDRDPYPDYELTMGPRGGVVVSRC